MAVVERQNKMLNELRKADAAISGTALAQEFHVSRQIIVQDITRLRELGHNILSTPKGYVYVKPESVSRVFKVFHTDERTEAELNLIVDLGGEVSDVFIFHKVYGEIRAKLGIACRSDVANFMEGLRTGKSSPLKNTTAGYHYHTVLAKNEEILSRIEAALKEEGFWAALTDYEPASIRESYK